MSTRTQMFIDKVKPGALKLWDKFGVLPSVAIGQAILESAWGSSGLAIKYNNLFGIKGEYQGNSAMLNTWEVYDGKRYDIKDGFRVYPDWATSILDYGVFLKVNPRYAQALKVKEYKTQITRIHKAGYATDPDYANKIISIIEKYKLNELDGLVLGRKPSPPPPSTSLPTIKYSVRTGDTLSHIAEKFQTTTAWLVARNNIVNPNLIYSGQVLRVPNTAKEYYIVEPGDNLTRLAERFHTTVQTIASLNGIKNPNLIRTGQRLRVK